MDFSNWSKPAEGWDAGAIETTELVDNVTLVAKNSVPAIAMALGVLWVINFLPDILITVVLLVAQFSPGVAGVAATAMALTLPITILVALVVGLGVPALMRPMQMQAFEGKDFVNGPSDAFRLAREVVGKTVVTSLLFSVSVMIGGLACGIGALVPLFFFVQAPYLAATTELPPMECMRRSYELTKAYALPVAIALGASLVSVGVLSGCGGSIAAVVGELLSSVFPPIGYFVGSLGADIASFVGAFASLVFTTAIFTSIQSIERGVPLAR